MERRIGEERITKSIISWLERGNWEIVCYDFPQSGTGRVLHIDERAGVKNKETIIPDIVAIKNGVVVFFENKDRFYLPDFEKIWKIKMEKNYSVALGELLSDYEYQNIYYGVGLPISDMNRQKVENASRMVDFIVDSDGARVSLYFQNQIIF